MSRVVKLGEGTDHRAYQVNGELVVRFATDPDPHVRAATRRQARLLTEVARLSPLPTPVPDLADGLKLEIVHRPVERDPIRRVQELEVRLDLLEDSGR